MRSKKLTAIALSLICALSLTACLGGGKEKTPAAADGSSENAVSTANAEFKIKFAHAGSETTLIHKAILEIERQIETNSEGRIDVQIYPNAQLGSDSQVIEALQNGDIQMTSVNTGALVPFVKDLNVFAIPFAFPNEETAYKVLDGEFGTKMSLALEEEMGVIGLGYLESMTFRQLMTNKAVRTPDDLKGLKIRVMDNPVQIKIWESLGANPTPIPFPELYTALQQGTVDAQENPLELSVAMRFYEVLKSVTLTNHVFTVSQVLISPDFYNTLPEDLQTVVKDAARAGVLYQREDFKKEYENLIQTLTDNNIEIIELTDAQTEAFKTKAAPAVEFIRKEVGNDLVDEFLAAIEAAR